MSRDLTGLFNPKSIAIVGASESPEKVGAIALKNIIVSGYSGHIYPVNPNVSNIGALKFYPNLASLPEIPDLAVIAIPANLVIAELEECGQAGVKNAVVFTAGFKEIGEAGEELEKQLIATADKYKLNILGPNCLGFATTNPPLNVTFGQVIKNQGNLKFISQSGAIAASLFDWCQSSGLGFNDFMTIGNKSIISENEILDYWLPQLKQPTTPLTPVGMYLESITLGSKFVEIIKQITPYNPVFILKPGKSPSAAKAMHSHTGAIAGEDRILEAALTEAGVIRCQELGDFFDLAQAFAWENVPKGPQVAVISNAGGPAVLTTDTIAEMGLEMAKFSQTAQEKLLECLPRMASIVNPIDVLGDALALRFGQALEIVLEEKAAKAILVVLTPQLMTQIEKTADIIGQLSKKYSQPIFCAFIGGNHTVDGQKILNRYKIPNYPFPERAIKVIAAMWQWQKWRLKPLVVDKPIKSIANDPKILTAIERRDNDQLMTAINIPIPSANIVTTLDEAKTFTQSSGWPVVMKLLTPGLLHKADVGGVITNIKSDSELGDSFKKLSLKIIELSKQYPEPIKIQIQKQIQGGVEVILGIKRDPTFGPVCLFGAGGRYAEIFDDHNLELLPLSQGNAKTLVGRSKVFKLLSGFRDDPAYELDQLYEVMMKLGRLVTDYPQISEIEINPLIITHDGVWAVDPKIILS